MLDYKNLQSKKDFQSVKFKNASQKLYKGL